MVPPLDLRPDTILLDHPAASLGGVLDAAAEVLAAETELEQHSIRRALDHAASESTFALGSGIAVPHVPVPELRRRAVCLVRTAAPIAIGALDDVAVDVFFAVLYPARDPTGHLRFLAHLAGLCRSRPFRDGLRAAAGPRDVLELVAAAEARLRGVTLAAPPAANRRGLALVSVRGERAADTILMSLLRAGLAGASVVDAQTLHEAASREVPLFAGFRDLFGDPGGRRMIFAHVDLEHTGALAALVEQACDEEGSASAELVVLPITGRWEWPARDEE